MNKLTLYKGLFIALAVLNVILVTFLFIKKSKKRIRPREVVIEKLDFTPQQIERYDELITVHKANVKKSGRSIQFAKQALYNQLAMKEQNATVLDSLKDKISLAQRNIENIHYNHFLDIKKICRPKQQPAFDALTVEISQIFNPRKRHPKSKKSR